MASQAVALELETEGVRQWFDGSAGAQSEARGLFALVSNGKASIEDIHELIDVSPREERLLRAFMHDCPEDARGLERVFRFRERVRAEFDRLVRESQGSEMEAA